MKKFWIKLFLFLLFALIIPCGYLIIRFDLFSPENMKGIGLGGFIVVCILASVVVLLIKTYVEGMKTKYSLVKQILSGVIKVIIPLGLLLLGIYWLGDNIYKVKEALLIIIPSEAIAIVVNPLPQWCFENNVEGLGEIFDKITKHKDKKGDE